jgi:choline-glycine betaine transporter
MSSQNHPHLPVIPIDPQRCHAQKIVDFGDETEITKFMRPNRWLKIDIGGFKVCRFNWVVFTFASIILWAFVIGVLAAPDNDAGSNKALVEFGTWQSWITQNFTWLYIGTQDAWILFVLYMGFSRFGNLKLGKDTEQPIYGDMTWFAMLFCSGIGIGLYFYGVSEPIYYYRLSYENKLFKVPFQNDDQRAQQALFVVLYHWGFHAWGAYILTALTLGFVAYRWDMPMTLRMAFYPLVGDVVHGLFGDFVDFLSMACTTFGVCTSLGFGVDVVLSGLRRVDCGTGATCTSDVPLDDGSLASKNWKVAIICVITATATFSVVTGIDKGLKTLSQITFFLGNLLLFSLVYLDNTWFLLNSYVQSMGHYLTYVTMAGFQTDAFEQLSHEFKPSSLLWDQAGFREDAEGKSYWANKVYDSVTKATGQPMASAAEYYGSHNSAWIDWWTIFYWGWWVSWTPFVGIFIATISRGRTIRQVVFGGFVAPIIYSFFFLIVLGSLGIKMQRVAELGLNHAPDVMAGSVNCTAMGYDGGVPVSKQAVGLGEIGYFSLACRAHADRLFDVLSPYGQGIFTYLGIISLIGVILYFVTSSDSGSYVDDTISAGGLQHCPIPQRIYWAVTEGACAIALMFSGGTAALKALQAVSIISGFPLTMAICYFCASLHRACKYDMGEEDIVTATRFITGLFDWTEGFKPNMPPMPDGIRLPSAGERATSLAVSIFAPFFTLHDMNIQLFSPTKASVITAVTAALFVTWIGCMFGELNAINASFVGWVMYTLMILIICYVRIKARQAYNVYGYWLEDAFSCLMMYPFVCSQLSLQAKAVKPKIDINADPNEELYAHLKNKDTTPGMADAKEFQPTNDRGLPLTQPEPPQIHHAAVPGQYNMQQYNMQPVPAASQYQMSPMMNQQSPAMMPGMGTYTGQQHQYPVGAASTGYA